jgi:glycosyltransferase involved in cell wall biosynthesis
VDGVNALLTDPGDTDGLAGAIRRVLGSAQLRDRLTAAGVRTAERFSYLNGVDDLIRIYGTLPAARPDRADY